MKKSYRSIAQLFGIVFLLTLLLTPVVSAQPATQYLNVLGSSFTPTSSAQGYSTGEGCIWDTGGIDSFSFPVLLPRGSLIKRLEFYFFEFTPPVFPPTPPFSTLSLLKYDPFANTSTTLVAFPLVGIIGRLKLPTAELNITVETDCTVDSQCFYELTWHPKAINTSRLCGARIYYIPPFGALALPIIQKN